MERKCIVYSYCCLKGMVSLEAWCFQCWLSSVAAVTKQGWSTLSEPDANRCTVLSFKSSSSTAISLQYCVLPPQLCTVAFQYPLSFTKCIQTCNHLLFGHLPPMHWPSAFRYLTSPPPLASPFDVRSENTIKHGWGPRRVHGRLHYMKGECSGLYIKLDL